jgi:hypothetical protein
LIGIKNTKPIIYKCIACNGVVVAGIGEVDAAIFVVADIVTGYCVVVGIGEADTVFVVVEIVAGNGVVAGRVDADAVTVVADIVAGYCVVAGNYIYTSTFPHTSRVCCIESFKRNPICI